MDSILHKTNFMYGAAVAALAAVFGEYWFLFAGFLAMNVIDWLTGWYVARIEKRECSAIGLQGILKKVFYWIVIAIAFYIGYAFEKMGLVLGIPLKFMNFVGFFVLASFLVNETRSILENVVQIDPSYVPEFLIRGLKITNDLLQNAVKGKLPDLDKEEEDEKDDGEHKNKES